MISQVSQVSGFYMQVTYQHSFLCLLIRVGGHSSISLSPKCAFVFQMEVVAHTVSAELSLLKLRM